LVPSVWQVFDFVNNHQFRVFSYLKNEKTVSSRYLKTNQNQRTAGSGCFKNHKEPCGFHNSPLFDFFKKIENHDHLSRVLLLIGWEL
jgi:hypothetical protein